MSGIQQTKTAPNACGVAAVQDEGIIDVVEALKRNFVAYPQTTTVENDLERLLKYGTVGRCQGTSASTYMLIGESGSGKTALLKRFCAKHPMRFEEEQDVHPVLFVEVPSKTTRKALAECILASLGVSAPSSLTEIKLTARAVHHLKEQGVRVLILDEAQHLVIPEKRQLNFEAADWVKGLANKGVCAVMLAGVPDAWEAYMYNGQLRRRSFGNRRLTPFAVSDQVGWRTFRGLVRAFARLLPFAHVTCLADQVTALQLHRQCGGFVGRLADFLVLVTINGLETGKSGIDSDLLEEAAEQVADLGDAAWCNPFEMSEAELLEAVAKDAEANKVGAGLVRLTGLRRGKRGLKQADVLG